MALMLNNTKKVITSDGREYTVRLSRERIFSPEEWNKFYNQLRKKHQPVFDCLINTGARISEVLGIKKKDIDFNAGVITLNNIKRRKSQYSQGKSRIIKISTEYTKKLALYALPFGPDDEIFSNKTSKVSLHQVMKRALKKSGISDWENFSLHNIRKTTECWLNYLGSNHLILLKHFGHNEATALKHYINVDTYSSTDKFQARLILGDLYI